jgi:hypothetical protein
LLSEREREREGEEESYNYLRCVYTIGITVGPDCRVGASGQPDKIKSDGIFVKVFTLVLTQPGRLAQLAKIIVGRILQGKRI